CCRLDFPLIFLALRLLPLFFSCCLQENRRGLHTLRLRHGHEFAQALLRWRSRFPFVWERAEERSGCPPLARAGAASRQQGPSAVDAGARAWSNAGQPAISRMQRGRRIMRNRFRWWSIVAAVLGTAVSAQAQSPSSYPDRPIRLVVAFPPGGATDTFARQITQELGEALGQSVVIENKPGAGGYLVWNYFEASDPDGYTLLMAENAIGINQALYKRTSSSFDPVKQYDAIATAATSPLVLAVANNVKANSVAELIAYSRT